MPQAGAPLTHSPGGRGWVTRRAWQPLVLLRRRRGGSKARGRQARLRVCRAERGSEGGWVASGQAHRQGLTLQLPWAQPQAAAAEKGGATGGAEGGGVGGAGAPAARHLQGHLCVRVRVCVCVCLYIALQFYNLSQTHLAMPTLKHSLTMLTHHAA